ncbi:MAG TPA: trehalase family glycosidase, partial [Polyangiaceae bacterium]|nr:trehalase family glycosidase [Polyangiaceae bacterium]
LALAGLASGVALASSACSGASDSPAAREPAPYAPYAPEPYDPGPSLGASFADPILLTFAAARPRARYLGDQGYTLTRSPEGFVSLSTQSAGDLGVAFQVDGAWLTEDTRWAKPVEIVSTASDSVVYRFSLLEDLAVEARFVVVSSATAALDVHVTSTGTRSHTVVALPFLRSCEAPFTRSAARLAGGVRVTREVPPPAVLPVIGPGTYLTELADGLVAPSGADTDAGWDWAGIEACAAGSSPSSADVLALHRAWSEDKKPTTLAAVALAPMRAVIEPGVTVPFRVRRTAVDAKAGDTLGAELAKARLPAVPTLLAEGRGRVEKLPPPKAGLTRDEALLWRSSLVLLDQLLMPAEGKLRHDYFLFSREPTWWFARLGLHIHEALAMLLLARSDPAAATEVLRNFIDRTEPDGYLPYNFGPVVEQTVNRTASAPLFSYIAWEVYSAAKEGARDAAFLRDAYAAGQRIHGFWTRERDTNKNGLFEWGGLAVSESLRDLENVIWTKVASPELVEAIDLQVEMIVEEQSLARMADALGLPAEAAAWRAKADALAGLVNAKMWDEASGFYFHIGRDSQSFTFKTEGDLKRKEIAGLLPLWANIVPPERRARLVGQLTDPTTFFRPFGVTGLDHTDPYFSAGADRCCRWNGPVWVPWMMLLQRGLVASGRPDVATELSRRTRAGVIAQLARTHQFRELYNPDDQSAPNASMPNYVWSTLAALMMMEE